MSQPHPLSHPSILTRLALQLDLPTLLLCSRVCLAWNVELAPLAWWITLGNCTWIFEKHLRGQLLGFDPAQPERPPGATWIPSYDYVAAHDAFVEKMTAKLQALDWTRKERINRLGVYEQGRNAEEVDLGEDSSCRDKDWKASFDPQWKHLAVSSYLSVLILGRICKHLDSFHYTAETLFLHIAPCYNVMHTHLENQAASDRITRWVEKNRMLQRVTLLKPVMPHHIWQWSKGLTDKSQQEWQGMKHWTGNSLSEELLPRLDLNKAPRMDSAPRWTSLTSFNLRDNKVEHSFLTVLLMQAPSLKTLNLTQVDIQPSLSTHSLPLPALPVLYNEDGSAAIASSNVGCHLQSSSFIRLTGISVNDQLDFLRPLPNLIHFSFINDPKAPVHSTPWPELGFKLIRAFHLTAHASPDLGHILRGIPPLVTLSITSGEFDPQGLWVDALKNHRSTLTSLKFGPMVTVPSTLLLVILQSFENLLYLEAPSSRLEVGPRVLEVPWVCSKLRVWDLFVDCSRGREVDTAAASRSPQETIQDEDTCDEEADDEDEDNDDCLFEDSGVQKCDPYEFKYMFQYDDDDRLGSEEESTYDYNSTEEDGEEEEGDDNGVDTITPQNAHKIRILHADSDPPFTNDVDQAFMATQLAFFRRLATLSHLETITIACGGNDPSVDLSLRTGLAELAPLTKLRLLDMRPLQGGHTFYLEDEAVFRVSERLRVAEAKWMLKHWPKLGCIRGLQDGCEEAREFLDYMALRSDVSVFF